MLNKEMIRPLYAEIRGYLYQAPEAKATFDSIHNKDVWDQFNGVIKLLEEITEKNYSRFIIKPKESQVGDYVSVILYRQKLGGLLSSLHAEYFNDEVDPLHKGPATVISQNQQQQQTVHIQMILDMQSKIDGNIDKYEEGSKEKGFLRKVKSSLSSVKNVIQLLSLLLNTAKDFGLNIQEVISILGL